MSSELQYKLACYYAWAWRFRNLQFAERLFRKVPPGCVMSRSLFGFKFFIDVSRTITHKLLYLQGKRFIDERIIVTSLLKPGQRVVDVGANIGYYMLMFQSIVGSTGKIICFEPEPSNLVELKSNINGNDFTNVQLFEAAVGMEVGAINFSCGINGMVAENGRGEISVDLVTLDSVIDERVDMIKIDVEGYEAQVLIGASGLIKRYKPTLFVELHPHLLAPPYSIKDIVEYIREHYRNITFYEKQRQNAVSKVIGRYMGREPIVVSPNPEKLLEECLTGKKNETFWMACSC